MATRTKELRMAERVVWIINQKMSNVWYRDRIDVANSLSGAFAKELAYCPTGTDGSGICLPDDDGETYEYLFFWYWPKALRQVVTDIADMDGVLVRYNHLQHQLHAYRAKDRQLPVDIRQLWKVHVIAKAEERRRKAN